MTIKWIVRLGVTVLVVGLLIALAVVNQGRRGDRLRADSLEAVADTQRTVLGATVRRAVQAEIERSELDKKLKAKPKVVIRTVVEFRPVETTTEAPVTSDPLDSVRRAVFRVDSAPLRGTVTAELPKAPAPGKLTLRLGIDPLPIIPMVKCSTEKFNGVYRAMVAFDSMPDWAKVNIREAQTDEGVCNPKTGFSLGFEVPWWTLLLASAGGIVAGAILIP